MYQKCTRTSHSRPRPRTTRSPKRRKVRGDSFGFEGDNGKSDCFVEYASDVNDNQRTLRSDFNLLGDNTAKIQLRQGYCYQFQKTGACTKVNRKGLVKIILLPVIALSFPHFCPKLEQTLHIHQRQHS